MDTDLYIVVIELGSSKITGLGGKKKADGSLDILAFAQEESSSFIKKGLIHNMDKSVQCIKTIINRLEEQLKRKISQVYVAYGGKSIHSQINYVNRQYETERPISESIVQDLFDDNITSINDFDLLDSVVQEYIIGSQSTLEPIGVLGNSIEGHFMNILARKALLANIESCFKASGVKIIKKVPIPLLLGDEILTDFVKNSGCMLVDMGADTTSVMIYKNKILRYVSVIPLGSDNITKDIMSLQVEKQEAEELKMGQHGFARYDYNKDDDEDCALKESDKIIYTTSTGFAITKGKFSEVIDARITEIVENVKVQLIESHFPMSTLLAGVFLTGGGANIQNISQVFKEVLGADKVTISNKGLTTFKLHVFGKENNINAAIALFAQGKQNCCGITIEKEEDSTMFKEQAKEDITANINTLYEPKIKEEKEEQKKEKKPKFTKLKKLWQKINESINEE